MDPAVTFGRRPSQLRAREHTSLDELGRRLGLTAVPRERRPGDDREQGGRPPEEHDVVRGVAQSTLQTVERAAAAFRNKEAQVHSLAQHAIEQLAMANNRIRELEGQLVRTEARAKEAERWLLKLQASVQETLAEWQADAPYDEAQSA
jgi:hypothetical protein